MAIERAFYPPLSVENPNGGDGGWGGRGGEMNMESVNICVLCAEKRDCKKGF